LRAPFQILVFPYQVHADTIRVLIGKRSDAGFWQGISGGGEDNESAIEAAKRELDEEASLIGEDWLQLDSKCMLPKVTYTNNEQWHDHKYVIPEYTFMTRVQSEGTLSEEHTEFRWLSFSDASERVKYDSNRIALWEMEQRLNA
jgi:dATP pyrophosphohydrolase